MAKELILISKFEYEKLLQKSNDTENINSQIFKSVDPLQSQTGEVTDNNSENNLKIPKNINSEQVGQYKSITAVQQHEVTENNTMDEMTAYDMTAKKNEHVEYGKKKDITSKQTIQHDKSIVLPQQHRKEYNQTIGETT